MKKENLTICFFGIYNPEYSRNKILLRGLRQNGVQIIECRSELRGIKKYFDLIKKHWKIRKKYDVLLVAFPGYQSMILARLLTKKKIIFDAFASIYDSEVCDRKTTAKNSLKAKYYWLLDWLSCKLAGKVLLDTNEHIKYFVQEFGIRKEKFERILIGADDIFFRPKKEYPKNDKFIIHFHGTNIPLQGIKYILEVARVLKNQKDILFVLVGPNIENKQGQGLKPENVIYIGSVPFAEIPDHIDKANLCLGIFGETNKTQRVIPNKVYEYIARKKPVITAETPAIRELFGENDLALVPSANSEVLKETILKLKDNPERLDYLAQNSYNKLIQNATSQILGSQIKTIIQELI